MLRRGVDSSQISALNVIGPSGLFFQVTRSTTTSLLRYRIVERGVCALADRGVLRFRIEEALKRARFEEFALRQAEHHADLAPTAEAA